MPGEVWYVDDQAIQIPPPPGTIRTLHPNRMVVVVSNAQDCSDSAVWTVLMVPLSSRVDLARRFDVRLIKGEGGVTKDCIAQVSVLGPVPKAAFVQRIGVLPVSRFRSVQAALRLLMALPK
jgi:mRNA-degrading endonuclease toxin of MazEF toxin-antitoxin module